MTREEAIRLIGWLKCTTNREDDLEAIDMAIEALQEVQKHEETFEWCTDCKEYDKDNYCCHRWSKMIRNTVEELKEYSGLVRCKDCRHYEDGMIGYCGELERGVSEDFYCYYGERREE